MPGSEISAKDNQEETAQSRYPRGVAGTLLVQVGHSQSEPKFY